MMEHCRVIDLVRPDDTPAVELNASLREAAERFLQYDCELLAVTDRNNKLAGVVSESSVVRALLNTTGQPLPLVSVLNYHAASVRHDLDITHALHLFRSSCHSAVPVVNGDGELCGMLRRRDVVQFLLNGEISIPPAQNAVRYRLETPRGESTEGDTAGAHSDSPHATAGPAEPDPSGTGPSRTEIGDSTSDRTRELDTRSHSAGRPWFLRGQAARERLMRHDRETDS